PESAFRAPEKLLGLGVNWPNNRKCRSLDRLDSHLLSWVRVPITRLGPCYGQTHSGLGRAELQTAPRFPFFRRWTFVEAGQLNQSSCAARKWRFPGVVLCPPPAASTACGGRKPVPGRNGGAPAARIPGCQRL